MNYKLFNMRGGDDIMDTQEENQSPLCFMIKSMQYGITTTVYQLRLASMLIPKHIWMRDRTVKPVIVANHYNILQEIMGARIISKCLISNNKLPTIY